MLSDSDKLDQEQCTQWSLDTPVLEESHATVMAFSWLTRGSFSLRLVRQDKVLSLQEANCFKASIDQFQNLDESLFSV